MTDTAPTDTGLQAERTALAWRRTLLALTVAALIALRLPSPTLGHWATGAALAALLLSATLWKAATRRAQQVQRALVSSGPLPDAALLLVLALIVTAVAMLGLLSVAVAAHQLIGN